MQNRFRLQTCTEKSVKLYECSKTVKVRGRSKDRFKDIEFLIRTIYTDCSRAYHILRHILYHSAAKSEKETSRLAAGSPMLCGHNDVMSHII